ncbi:MAG: hypothetical protein ACM336_19065 [Acidobacteriota bacterium]
MPSDFRHFEAADPAGGTWKIDFLWQQNAISIRHADAIDVKFALSSGDTRATKVIALTHPLLLELSRTLGRPLTDAWCSRLAAAHLKRMIETGEDMDKDLVTPSLEALCMDSKPF